MNTPMSTVTSVTGASLSVMSDLNDHIEGPHR